MSVKQAMKFVKVHNGIKVEQADLKLRRGYMLKWTAADEICKLNLSLFQAAAIVPLRFRNWIEDELECQAVITKNTAIYDALSNKYKFLCFIDPDGDNVVDIEW
jgi:hypothetical protein